MSKGKLFTQIPAVILPLQGGAEVGSQKPGKCAFCQFEWKSVRIDRCVRHLIKTAGSAEYNCKSVPEDIVKKLKQLYPQFAQPDEASPAASLPSLIDSEASPEGKPRVEYEGTATFSKFVEDRVVAEDYSTLEDIFFIVSRGDVTKSDPRAFDHFGNFKNPWKDVLQPGVLKGKDGRIRVLELTFVGLSDRSTMRNINLTTQMFNALHAVFVKTFEKDMPLSFQSKTTTTASFREAVRALADERENPFQGRLQKWRGLVSLLLFIFLFPIPFPSLFSLLLFGLF
uniref:Uncharacterized protein n=1 Tax=Chromera velia CCMP2878 TaxID=1169474 RepID=A0A0G4FX79_9ALVE|eukprot:Cvel_19220.t1-p1 / transcript=Cvel_19220.t1 / gene=Cvel_19220 / organism=Chromera_velia_CCMP2878 / gene_product=hypothetical protein / transcript_product=hypothetical protein / location=Cvel_scaffold1642:3249-8206(+) / protein_length=283 / sequence_SO=supercontig / SO=protein_coding / is_pseudo=false